ncbi:helix-turn-helix domain-containing protein [Streptomyces sp. PSKA30]|uniref:helix-turn-helix domain-containing protein n=1 Tax=Streptomyces sp. PSKA30 TaxID=2874597 RepID=UPI001CD0948E|nr:helix-turn-helix transcriptional regulator [Streptomyces sp. PSKA30]MBZ9638004.1 helix-turn-helix transcriptional regulator [Streptomyces sp. PSKA30]
MSTPPEGPTEAIARRVSALRQRKGLNRQQLGEAMAANGVEWNRFTVSSLENGKRQNVTVVELLTLAKVLDVAPVHLLVPLEDEHPYQVTPKLTMPATRVRAWIRGQKPLPGTDLQIFYTEVPLDEVRSVRTVQFGGRHGSAELNAWASEEQAEGGDSGE